MQVPPLGPADRSPRSSTALCGTPGHPGALQLPVWVLGGAQAVAEHCGSCTGGRELRGSLLTQESRDGLPCLP